MLRKLCVTLVAVVIPVSVISASGSVAGATRLVGPPVDAASYTASCSGLGGVLKFSPSLQDLPSIINVEVHATLSGCTAKPDGAGAPVDIVKGKVSETLSINSGGQNDCTHVLFSGGAYSTTGSLTITWKTARDTPISSGNTVVSPTEVTITEVTPGPPPQSEITSLAFPGPGGSVTSTGSFAGTNSGASDSISISESNSLNPCFTGRGLRKLILNAPGSADLS
jgi:hypothetical protein